MTYSGLMYGLFATFDYAELSIEQLRGLTAPFGMTETNLRSTLSRMHCKGVLAIRRTGRTASYRPTAESRRFAGNVARAFEEPDGSGWRGEIAAIVFSLGGHGADRYQLQKRLRTYRFAPLFPGYWIRPYEGDGSVPGSLSEFLSPGVCHMSVGPLAPPIGVDDAERLWSLSVLAGRMGDQAEVLEAQLMQLGRMRPEEAFRAKVTEGRPRIGRGR